MVIINANIMTVESQNIENGYVEFENGKITKIGEMPYSGNSNEVIDAKGAFLLPGFVDAHCHLGLWEDGLGFEGADGNEDTDPSTPNMRAIDAINIFDRTFEEALSGGVTTAIIGPGSANAIGGQIAALKTYNSQRDIEKMLIKTPIAMKMALGENPKTVYNEKNQAPVTRMATAAIIREQLELTKTYYKKKVKASADEDTDMPDYEAKYEALIPVIKGELPVHFHAHRLDDMQTAIRIAKEFNLKYVIIHGTQAHIAPELIVKNNVPVLCGPILTDRSKPEMKDLTPAGPGILFLNGVKIAITTDSPVIPQQYLALCAGLAAREGLPYDEAIRSITLSPAEICGIDEKVGSIKVGKDADLILFKEDPLALSSKPEMIFVDGKIAYEKDKSNSNE